MNVTIERRGMSFVIEEGEPMRVTHGERRYAVHELISPCHEKGPVLSTDIYVVYESVYSEDLCDWDDVAVHVGVGYGASFIGDMANAYFVADNIAEMIEEYEEG